jgi:SnoaL-like domain
VSALDIVNTYYDAWINKQGDFADVPLADDFRFSGPVVSFEDADAFRSMARQAGQAITKFSVREQFVNGNRVCSIIDWEMALPVSPMTAAEILEVDGDEIVRGELIYDAEELRKAMAGAES